MELLPFLQLSSAQQVSVLPAFLTPSCGVINVLGECSATMRLGVLVIRQVVNNFGQNYVAGGMYLGLGEVVKRLLGG